MDAALQSLRENFGRPQSRMENLLFMYNQVLRHAPTFPRESVESLDALVTKMLSSDESEKSHMSPLVVLEGEYSCDIGPNSTYESGYGRVSRYQFYFLGLDIHLGTFQAKKIKNPRMHVKARLSKGRELCIDYTLEGIGEMEHNVDLPAPFDCSIVRKRWFGNFTGVILKKAGEKGKTSLLNHYVSLGTENSCKYVFVFFDRGNLYFFNDEGYEVTSPSEKLIDRCRRRRESRIEKITAAYNAFDATQNSKDAEAWMIRNWEKYPDYFGKRGKRIYISGEKHGSTNYLGNFDLVHYKPRKEGGFRTKHNFFVDLKKPNTPSVIYWRGPYVVIKDMQGNILNAHKLLTHGLVTLTPQYMDGLEEAMGLINLNYLALPRISVNTTIYSFSSTEIRKLLKGFPDDCRKALYAHVYFGVRGKEGECSVPAREKDEFRLLVKYDDDLFSYPVQCINSYRRCKC